MEFLLVQTVRVAGRARNIVRGVIRSVPERTTARTVTTALDTAGYAPAEAGIPWANHVVRDAARLTDAERPATVPEWDWAELNDDRRRPQRQLNVRIPRTLYTQCEAAAAASGQALRGWVERALEEAAAKGSAQ